MPNESRVLQTIPGTAPSGAADALFKMLSETKDLEKFKAKETIQSDLRMKEATQASGFNTALEALRSQNRLAELAKTHDLQTELETKRGQGMLDVLGTAAPELHAQGADLGGLITESPETSQATGRPAGSLVTAPPIGGAGLLKDMFTNALKAHFDKRALTYGVTAEAEKARLLDQLGLMTDAHAAQAGSLATELDTFDPGNAFSKRLKTLQAGVNSRKEFETFTDKAAMALEANRLKRQQFSAYGSFRVEAARIAADAKKYAADAANILKHDKASLDTLGKHRQAIKDHLSYLNTAEQNLLQQAASPDTTPAMAQTLQGQIAAGRQRKAELEASYEAVSAQLARISNMSPDAGLTSPADDDATYKQLLQAVKQELADKKGTPKYAKRKWSDLKPSELEEIKAEAAKRFEGLKARRAVTPTPPGK